MLHMKQTEILKMILQERYPDHTALERAHMQEELEMLYQIFTKLLNMPEREARRKVILRAKAHDFTGEFSAKAEGEQKTMIRKAITQKELDVILRKHRRWLESGDGGGGFNISRANLSGFNLSGLNLSGLNLSGANFSGADLSGTDFSGTILSGANFMEAFVAGANFSGTKLSGADFSGADLSETDLSGTDLFHAKLTEADLLGANLYDSSLPLWWGSLQANFDDEQLIQIAYHLVKAGLNSKNASAETKAELAKLIDFANQFHGVEDFGKIELTGEFLEKAKEKRKQQ